MQTVQLYNVQKKNIETSAVSSHNSLLAKSVINENMSTKQIANIISDKLISHIDKALERIVKK